MSASPGTQMAGKTPLVRVVGLSDSEDELAADKGKGGKKRRRLNMVEATSSFLAAATKWLSDKGAQGCLVHMWEAFGRL
eukprot:5821130-Alexandrium_andersonii.AAC.1